jgi:hypothetical protein
MAAVIAVRYHPEKSAAGASEATLKRQERGRDENQQRTITLNGTGAMATALRGDV